MFLAELLKIGFVIYIVYYDNKILHIWKLETTFFHIYPLDWIKLSQSKKCLIWKDFFPFLLLNVRIRSVGTAAVNMCLVATGGADAYYEMGIHCWDMAGAGIIVTEAGGVLMDVTGTLMELKGIFFFMPVRLSSLY